MSASAAPPLSTGALHVYGRKFTMPSELQLIEAIIANGGKEDFEKTAAIKTLPQCKSEKETVRRHRDRFRALKKLFTTHHQGREAKNLEELLAFLRSRQSAAASRGKVEPLWNVKRNLDSRSESTSGQGNETGQRTRKRAHGSVETDEEAEGYEEEEEREGAEVEAAQRCDESSSTTSNHTMTRAAITASTTRAQGRAPVLTPTREAEQPQPQPQQQPPQPNPPQEQQAAPPSRLERIKLALRSPIMRDFEVVLAADASTQERAGEVPHEAHAEHILSGRLVLRVAEELQPLRFSHKEVLPMLLDSPVRDMIPDYAIDVAHNMERLLRMLADLRNPLFVFRLTLEETSSSVRQRFQVRFDKVLKRFDEGSSFLLYAVNTKGECTSLLKLQSRDDHSSMSIELCVPDACVRVINDSTKEIVKHPSGALPIPPSLTLLTRECDCILYLKASPSDA